MAEEQSSSSAGEGFKFVDKRRTAVEADGAGSDSAESDSKESKEPETAVTADAEADLSEDESNADNPLDDSEFSGPDGVFGIVSYTIGLLSMSAWQYLGLIADPKTQKASKDLKQAHIAIDCVAGIVDALEKNAGSIDSKTMGDLKRVLNDLRLNFVTQSNMP